MKELPSIAELVESLPLVPEDAGLLIAASIAAIERGDEIDQKVVFAKCRAKYG